MSLAEAESLAKLLDQFERKIVPDLLSEAEQDKEDRFTQHENRMKTIWESYPAQPKIKEA